MVLPGVQVPRPRPSAVRVRRLQGLVPLRVRRHARRGEAARRGQQLWSFRRPLVRQVAACIGCCSRGLGRAARRPWTEHPLSSPCCSPLPQEFAAKVASGEAVKCLACQGKRVRAPSQAAINAAILAAQRAAGLAPAADDEDDDEESEEEDDDDESGSSDEEQGSAEATADGGAKPAPQQQPQLPAATKVLSPLDSLLAELAKAMGISVHTASSWMDAVLRVLIKVCALWWGPAQPCADVGAAAMLRECNACWIRTVRCRAGRRLLGTLLNWGFLLLLRLVQHRPRRSQPPEQAAKPPCVPHAAGHAPGLRCRVQPARGPRVVSGLRSRDCPPYGPGHHQGGRRRAPHPAHHPGSSSCNPAVGEVWAVPFRRLVAKSRVAAWG